MEKTREELELECAQWEQKYEDLKTQEELAWSKYHFERDLRIDIQEKLTILEQKLGGLNH